MVTIMKNIAMFMVWLTVFCVCIFVLLTMAGFLMFGWELAAELEAMT